MVLSDYKHRGGGWSIRLPPCIVRLNIPAMPRPDIPATASSANDPDLETIRRSIGLRLATLREERGLSLRALGDAAQVTSGFISQIENGHVMPSIASLLRIATALDRRVADFFEQVELPGAVRAPGSRTIYRYDEYGIIDEVLSDDPTGELEVLRTTIEPGGSTGDSVYVHGTRVETVYVLSGELVLGLGEQRIALSAGDSITFSGETAHGVWNESESRAEAIWVAAPARY